MRQRTITMAAVAVLLVGGAAGDAAAQATEYTAAQAERGKKAYDDNCAGCHGDKLEGDAERTPPLGADDFNRKWMGKAVTGFWNFMTTSMPQDRPGELPKAVYAEILAYILKFNGVPAGTAEFPAEPPPTLIIRRR